MFLHILLPRLEMPFPMLLISLPLSSLGKSTCALRLGQYSSICVLKQPPRQSKPSSSVPVLNMYIVLLFHLSDLPCDCVSISASWLDGEISKSKDNVSFISLYPAACTDPGSEKGMTMFVVLQVCLALYMHALFHFLITVPSLMDAVINSL